MPWNNQGGGPWQSGGRGPWGQPPGGGNQGGGNRTQGPDFEDLIRKGQDRFRKVMPGGPRSPRLILLVVIGLVGLWLASGFYRVLPDEQGVVLRFGEWVGTSQPGLHYHLPTPIESVLKPKVTRVNREEIGFRSGGDVNRSVTARDVPEESLMLTGDENIVDIDFNVFWLIKDAGQFLFNVQNPQSSIKAAAESAVREVVGRNPIQFALTDGRPTIESQSRELIQQILDSYNAGITVTEVKLQKVDPPAQVIDAFRDVQRARADLDRQRNEAEAYANDVLPRARGDAERLKQEAEGYREQVVRAAEGDANRFNAIYQEYSQAREVTARRMYLEMMENVLGTMNKVIIDPSVSRAGGVVPYLPLNDLQRAPAPPAPAPRPQAGPSQ